MSDIYPLLQQERSIADWMEAHAEELHEAGGVIPDEILGLIEANDAAFAARTERLVLTVRTLEAQAAAAQIEADRIRELGASRRRKAEVIKRNILRAFSETGRTLVETDLCRVSRVRGPVSVRMTDPDAKPPDRFVRIKYEFDKALAKKALAGYAPDECGVMELPAEGITLERKEQLRIK